MRPGRGAVGREPYETIYALTGRTLQHIAPDMIDHRWPYIICRSRHPVAQKI